MKSVSPILMMLIFCSACINNPLDSKQEDHICKDNPLRALLTKSASINHQEDSLTMMSRLQKDVDHMMMNRIIFKDSIYVLAIRRQDAAFLGVSEDVYDRYVEYVSGLNKTGN